MKRKLPIEQEVEKTMKSLDGIESAKANPFFYTRLQAKLERQGLAGKPKHAYIPRQTWVGLAWAAVLIVLINIISLTVYYQPATGEELEAREYYLEEIYEEYGLANNTVYDLPDNP